MNNYSKIYTSDTLKNNAVVTVVTMPLEESVMFPVSQAIDLMKQGENVLFFTFNHDSIKINEFMQKFLANEDNPENIKGNIGIIDAYQIPEGVDWIGFVEDTIADVKGQMDLNYVFFDVLPFVENHPIRPADDELVISTLTLLAFTRGVTTILIKTANVPVITAVQNKEEAQEIMEKEITIEDISKSRKVLEQSDLVLGVQREKITWWKKVINFLLFWRKRNNFTVRVLKNRNGNRDSYKMNLDMDNFKSEIL